jgi:hypothetical protein
MERHVFPADDNRCQQRHQLRTGTNHRTATSHCNRNTCSACSSSCRPLQVKFVLAVYIWSVACSVCIGDLLVYRLDISLVLSRKFHFCCRTAVLLYVWCKLQRFCFVTDFILYICMPGVFHADEKDNGCVIVFFISFWKLKFLAYLLNVTRFIMRIVSYGNVVYFICM